MPLIEFTSDFDFSPEAKKGNYTLAYKKGMIESVTTECAKKALELGRAKKVAKADAEKE